jgi:hypothetical protein
MRLHLNPSDCCCSEVYVPFFRDCCTDSALHTNFELTREEKKELSHPITHHGSLRVIHEGSICEGEVVGELHVVELLRRKSLRLIKEELENLRQ